MAGSEKDSQQPQAEIHERASQLAKLHERRDKEIVEIQRYEAVQGLVYQEPGVNRFQVCCRLLSAAQSICKLVARAVGHRAEGARESCEYRSAPVASGLKHAWECEPTILASMEC